MVNRSDVWASLILLAGLDVILLIIGRNKSNVFISLCQFITLFSPGQKVHGHQGT